VKVSSVLNVAKQLHESGGTLATKILSKLRRKLD